ncbi:MAG: CoA transferase, partial [Chloroflexi bacterium]|nr:CoA transferase [Chloroflexota bacterium]
MAELLDGIRVLDLTRGVAGPFATKLLADYGADVLKVEAPGGDPARREPPFFHDEPHADGSALFLHLNTNKRSLTLDLEQPEARAIVARLAATADVVVEDFAPGQLDAWGIGWERLAADRDDLVLASITPFGQSGPYRDYLASEITLQAIGGPLHLNGIAEREPLKLAGHVAHYHAGTVAAYAIMLTRRRVERGGAGDHIDLAAYECQAGFRDRRAVFLTHAAYTGRTIHRPAAGNRFLSGVRTALDGYVNLFVGAPRHLDEFLALIGRPDLAGHPEFRKSPVDMSADFAADVEASYLAWLMRTPKQEALAATQALGILGGAILTTEDLVRDPHYRERGAWEVIDHPHTGPVEYPGRQLILSETPRAQARHAPLLGEHNREVLCEALGYHDAEFARLQAAGTIAPAPATAPPARRTA